MTQKQMPYKRLASIRLIAALVGFIIAVNSLIIFSDQANRVFFSSWTVNATSLIALGVGLLVLYRQKQNGFYDKTYTSLVIALTLWFIAERISTYYAFGPEIHTTFPSFIDLFRLSAFGFFMYHLFKTYKLFGKSFKPYWVLLSLSILLNTAAYTGSVLGIVTHVTVDIWIPALLYNSGYICVATALFWHNRIFIFEGKAQQKPSRSNQ